MAETWATQMETRERTDWFRSGAADDFADSAAILTTDETGRERRDCNDENEDEALQSMVDSVNHMIMPFQQGATEQDDILGNGAPRAKVVLPK